jgi:AhpD family alkylhydroperoxidase
MRETTTTVPTEASDACGPDGGCALVQPEAARAPHPAMAVPGAMEALQALGGAIGGTGLPHRTMVLVNVRVSQINGCGVCLLGDLKAARESGITDEQLITVAGWRESPMFSAPERAALALAEEMTRMADRPDAVPDDVWEEATRHYDDAMLAGLTLAIANVNVWNRLNVATRQVAGTYEW